MTGWDIFWTVVVALTLIAVALTGAAPRGYDDFDPH